MKPSSTLLRLPAALAALAAVAMLAATCKQGTIVFKNSSNMPVSAKIEEYAEVDIRPDLSELHANDRQMLSTLMEVADIFDDLFWVQAFGDKRSMDNIDDDATRKFAMMNYGPWDRLNGNMPFVAGYEAKPFGANFYPPDMTKEEFANLDDVRKDSPYTMLRRDSNGQLAVIPYNDFFQAQLTRASAMLRSAAAVADKAAMRTYLNALAEALPNNYYHQSDLAWMNMHTCRFDFIAGPIAQYEDEMFEFKAAFQALLLRRNLDWSRRVERYGALMRQVKNLLPYNDAFKKKIPPCKADIGVYDAIYYRGYANTGSKTVILSLPNDERVYSTMGTRKLQIKNLLEAKFNHLLVPMAELMVAPAQQPFVRFDAFFEIALFRNLATDWRFHLAERTADESLRNIMKEAMVELDEVRSLISSIFIARELVRIGELRAIPIEGYYATFLTDMLRQIRYGESNINGRAATLTFNYLLEHGAVERTPANKYIVDPERMESAVISLLAEIFTVQSTGDYAAATSWLINQRKIEEPLTSDLHKINKAGIPRDILLKQGSAEVSDNLTAQQCPEK